MSKYTFHHLTISYSPCQVFRYQQNRKLDHFSKQRVLYSRQRARTHVLCLCVQSSDQGKQVEGTLK